MKVISVNGDERINDWNKETGEGNFEAYLMTASDGRTGVEPNYVGGNTGDPLVGGVTYPIRKESLRVINRGSLGDSVIHSIMNTRDRKPIILLVADNDGSNRRFLNVLVGKPAGGPKDFVFPCYVTGDVFPNAEEEVFNVVSITSDPQQITINSQAQADVYPRFLIRGLSNKTSTNPYKRFIAVEWPCIRPSEEEAVLITLDTQDAKYTGAAGEDLRVLLNNKETNIWIEDAKTASTKIWFLAAFKPDVPLTLKGSIGGADSEITFNESIDNLGETGYLKLATGEIVFYNSRNTDLNRVSGCTRDIEGGAGIGDAQTDGSAAKWLQNRVELTYGATSPTAYPTDDTTKPIFNLSTSTQTSRVYESFGAESGSRAASWLRTLLSTAAFYSATAEGTADPWSVIGVVSDTDSGLSKDVSGYASAYFPTGITNLNITSAKKLSDKPSRWAAVIRSSKDGQNYVDEYTIPAPTSPSSEQSWTQNISFTSGSLYAYMWLLGQTRTGSKHRVEIDTATVTLDSSNTPVVTVGAEQGNYALDITFTNITKGIAFRVQYDTKLNNDLEIDTANNTVTDLSDNSNQFQALDKLGGVRDHVFPISPGDNLIELSSPGVVSETLTIYLRYRFLV